MTANPAFAEKYTKSQRLPPRSSSGAKIFGHVSHSRSNEFVCMYVFGMSTL